MSKALRPGEVGRSRWKHPVPAESRPKEFGALADWLSVTPEQNGYDRLIGALQTGTCVLCGGALRARPLNGAARVSIRVAWCATCGFAWEWPTESWAIRGIWAPEA